MSQQRSESSGGELPPFPKSGLRRGSSVDVGGVKDDAIGRAVTDSREDAVSNPKPDLHASDLYSVGRKVETAAGKFQTRLSNAVQTVLSAPGKTAMTVQDPSLGVLSLERRGSDWVLSYNEVEDFASETWRDWSLCSIEAKARVAKLLPTLVSALHETNHARLTAVDDGIRALDEFDRLIAGGLLAMRRAN